MLNKNKILLLIITTPLFSTTLVGSEKKGCFVWLKYIFCCCNRQDEHKKTFLCFPEAPPELPFSYQNAPNGKDSIAPSSNRTNSTGYDFERISLGSNGSNHSCYTQ